MLESTVSTVLLRSCLSCCALPESAGRYLAEVPAVRRRTVIPETVGRRFRHSGGMRNRVREVPACREAQAGGQSVHGAETLHGVRAERGIAAKNENTSAHFLNSQPIRVALAICVFQLSSTSPHLSQGDFPI